MIVVGGGLGGLSAAIHLRLAGKDVLLLEANDRVGGRASRLERGGFHFDTGPSLINYPFVFEGLFRAAGKRLEDHVRLLPIDPSIRFDWPDGRNFTLSSDLPRLLDESERVEPGSRPGMMAFLRDGEAKFRLSFERIVPRNIDSAARFIAALGPAQWARTRMWRSLDSELGRFFRSPTLREALGSYAMYLGGSPYRLPGLFTILPWGELAHGLWLPEGGVYGLVAAIERLARDIGVEIRTGVRVDRIRVSGGRVRGVTLAGGERIDSEVVVSNVDVPTTDRALLPEGALSARAVRRSAGMKMTPGVVTFYWGIHGPLPQLPHHSVFLPEDMRGSFHDLFEAGRIPRGLPFYTSAPASADPALAPKGDTLLFVLVPVPRLSQMPGADWESIVDGLRDRVLERLGRSGVPLDRSRIAVEEVWTPADWAEKFGLHDGSAFGAAHTTLQLGPFRAPNISREIAGLYYTGASTTPGTGLPMVTIGGAMTAERITGQSVDWGVPVSRHS